MKIVSDGFILKREDRSQKDLYIQLIDYSGSSIQRSQFGGVNLKYSSYIEGLPSHLSVHSGGIIISERPTTWFSATFLPPKGFPTTQFSMLEAEDVGLYKFDILSQRGLSKIHESIDIIKYNRPEEELHDIHDVNHFKI
jgi:DNA polymerase-3 subunit alpha